ncbi:Gfo/Idh/MocA family oxidoreductase [Desulfobotulus sp.]|uniref:Gfo/Idh/MocA family protein n=1 Tax=Desulfobotulus sp. TaxID=1940337 RepID=UPI002A35F011|nr:Gfo/Idh/MocA family oxidoreductase [Desulfobotulus sp.]MDY0164824.1 Gfo/Idh/MocA family oxidoreductase [Desulfobotulus sp.]
MQHYRAALCGLGNIAWRFDHGSTGPVRLSHAGAFLAHTRVRLVSGFDPEIRERKAFTKALKLPAFDSLEALLAEKPDLVSICSPAPWHFEQAMACMEKAVPMIWLEKPPALTLGEMDALIQTSEQRGSTLLVNYQRRYLPSYQELKKALTEESLGPCRHIRAVYSRGLEANGSHMLDMIFFLTEDRMKAELLWVSGKGESPSFGFRLKTQSEIESTPNGMPHPAPLPEGDKGPCGFRKLPEDVEVSVTGMDLSYHNIDMELTCEQGRLSVLHGGMTALVEKKEEHEHFQGFFRLKTDPDAPLTRLSGIAGAMENALSDLMESHEKQRPPLSTLRSSRNTMALMERVRNFQKTGRAL